MPALFGKHGTETTASCACESIPPTRTGTSKTSSGSAICWGIPSCRAVDVDLIPEQWDQLVRVAASLKNRVCPAHVVVQRLANSSPSDRLAKALTMLGRVVKTIYILKTLLIKNSRLC